MTMSTSTSSSMDHSNPIETGIPTMEIQRSQNIPLPLSHTHRTQSEIQLCEDMETAEQRDLNMFYRLVNGIRERQINLVRENESSTAAAAFYNPAHALTEAERSLAHIIHTRNAPVDKRNTASTATSCKMNTGRRENTNTFLNNWHTNLNGFSIPEVDPDWMQQHQIQQETSDHENGWAVGGFESTSNLSDHCYKQQKQHGADSNLAMSGAATSTLTRTLATAHSSNEMVDEGMFDFEL